MSRLAGTEEAWLPLLGEVAVEDSLVSARLQKALHSSHFSLVKIRNGFTPGLLGRSGRSPIRE
jgi:hypothetical protein